MRKTLVKLLAALTVLVLAGVQLVTADKGSDAMLFWYAVINLSGFYGLVMTDIVEGEGNTDT